jgi:hypothetical protein
LTAALVLAGVLFVVFSPQGTSGSLTAEVYIGGKLSETIVLRGAAQERRLEGEGGWNLLRAEADGVRIAEADCYNLTCVHTGKITLPGQSIACLPHRVLVRLVGRKSGEEEEVDVIAR